MKWGYDRSKELPSKPEKFSEMIELAEKLAEGIPHVRIDLYFSNGNIYFGEMTFLMEVGSQNLSLRIGTIY